MTVPFSARFFAAIGVHPPYALLILGVILALGLWTTIASPAELDSALGMVLSVQMFLASTGFLLPARRGHFDALLVGKGRRTSPMIWHWVVSVTPGLAAWCCVSAVAWVQGSAPAVSAFTGGRAAAFVIVSTVAWAAGVALPGGGAGVVWIALLVALLLGRADLLSASSSLPVLGGGGWLILRQGLALIVCPFLLIGRHPAVSSDAIRAALLIALVVLLAVWRRADRLDLYLVDRT
jgi:hypothetical protein